jgi:L-lysine 6-transaminase
MEGKLLEKILKRGRVILQTNPSYLDKYTFLGHHPIGAVDYKNSHGPKLTNTKGETFYDSTAYWLTNLIDYKKYPELKNMTDYLGGLAIDAPTMSEMNTPEQAVFTNMMLGFWPKAKHVYIHPSGTLAVNDACWTACAAVAEKKHLKPQDLKGVAFTGAFHGRHDRTADATNPSAKVDFKQYKNRLIRCVAPNVVFGDNGRELKAETKALIDKSLGQVEIALKNPKTAYVIIEYPFQAEGGAEVIEKGVLAKLHILCQKYKKFLILDCVQMGGRSWFTKKGKVFPFTPEVLRYADIITFGKIFRCCGFMAINPVSLGRGFKEDTMDKNPARIGSTWVGRADQVLSGTAIMETVLQKKLWKNGLRHTQVILKRLAEISKGEVLLKPRGRAEDTAYIGWEFSSREVRDKFVGLMRDKYRILMLGAGEKSIRWGPFLDATDREIKNVLDSIEKCCKELTPASN